MLTLIILSTRSSSIVHAAPTGNVCGQITTNTTWIAANNPYTVTCDVQVMSSVTLTIQSGVIVKFTAGTSLRVDGTLIARGATFTSANIPPGQGDWGHIYFTPTSVDASYDAYGNYLSGSVIQDSLIEWGGGAANVNGAIETNIASPYIDHNTIQNSGQAGIYAIARSASQRIRISRNSLSVNNGGFWGLEAIHVSGGTIISNTIANNGATGVFATDSTIAGNLISANSGGGINATGSTVSGNLVSSNHGTGVQATSSTVTDNIITGNTAYSYGGIVAGGNSILTRNTITSNSGGNGGIRIDSGMALSNTVDGNTASGQGGGITASNATVSENVVRNNNAVDGGGIYSDNASLSRNTVSGNHASGKGGGIFALSSTTATENQINANTAAEGGGVYAIDWRGIKPNLTGNIIRNNAANFGGGITAINATVRGNTVISNTVQSDGGGIYADGGTVTQNKVFSNTTSSFGHGAGVYLKNVADFSHNSVSGNTAPSGTAGGVSIEGQPQIVYNNLYGNQPYDAEVVSTENVTATLNYWGALICTAIPSRIYDGNDAPPRGVLLYAPSLYSPAPLMQLSSPANLSLITGTSTVTLTWTPIPAVPNVGCRNPGQSIPDWGYRIYYDTDSCPPYQGTGLPQGNSPINAGQNATFVLNGLSGGDYHFVVAAYDYLGRVSTYSNEVVRLGQQRKVYLPVVLKSG
jgi:parallel beta-helix repeat protein